MTSPVFFPDRVRQTWVASWFGKHDLITGLCCTKNCDAGKGEASRQGAVVKVCDDRGNPRLQGGKDKEESETDERLTQVTQSQN